ncbi:hypothetical protein SNE40_008037 [Patella caerulea]|uniref:Uncharacterized protein n=1 Tax=Patella caerulea TaxID=87958 RepID=A0AAN8JYW5_PATCE
MVGEKIRVIEHIYRNHVSLDRCPFYCQLCSFRTTKLKELQKHTVHYQPHIKKLEEAKKRGDISREDPAWLICSANPYVLQDTDFTKMSSEASKIYWESKGKTQPISNQQPTPAANTPSTAIMEENFILTDFLGLDLDYATLANTPPPVIQQKSFLLSTPIIKPITPVVTPRKKPTVVTTPSKVEDIQIMQDPEIVRSLKRLDEAVTYNNSLQCQQINLFRQQNDYLSRLAGAMESCVKEVAKMREEREQRETERREEKRREEERAERRAEERKREERSRMERPREEERRPYYCSNNASYNNVNRRR